MDKHKDINRINYIKSRTVVIIGLIGIFISILLMTPIFSSHFAMSFLLKQDIVSLWFFSGFIFICSILIILNRLRLKFEIAALFLSVLILISIELGARLFVTSFMPAVKLRLARLACGTYPELTAFKGHPFLQFTGNPSVSPVGNRILGNLTRFNNFGFIGRDFKYEKPKNVIRIAALGSSTTATGYPHILEAFLNNNKNSDSYRFEVMNFGLCSYNSANSLVNFVINVVDFCPDYVIIHHAVNDKVARNTPSSLFRSDYSHALKYFHEPKIIDRYLIRSSILYRYFKYKLTNETDWAFLDNAIQKKKRPRTKMKWQNLNELEPYKRNIKTIVELAGLRGVKVVLTTQPHSSNPNLQWYSVTTHIDQCNDIMRGLYKEHQNASLFVDLDEMMTGKMDKLFNDIVHVNKIGLTFKAEQIGKVILSDLEDNKSWD